MEVIYQHKKFDQFKRCRDESPSTSSQASYTFSEAKRRRDESPSTSSQASSIFPETKRLRDESPSMSSQASSSFQETKRRRDESPSTSSQASYSFSDAATSLSHSSVTPGFMVNPHTPVLVDRFGTPSSVCTDFSGFNMSPSYSPYPLSSTPLVKRPRRNTPLEDSGVALSASTLDATAVLPKISHETLTSICKYHGNMVRKFPKKERSPKDQERRNKNTIACRMSRRVKKLEHIAIEEQYKEFSEQHMQIVEESMRAAAYLNELLHLNGVQSREKICESPAVPAPAPAAPAKKPFSIAYLVGPDA